MRLVVAALLLCLFSLPAQAVSDGKEFLTATYTRKAATLKAKSGRKVIHAENRNRIKAKAVPQRIRVASADPNDTPTWGPDLVSEARRYIGTNPTGRASLWCAHFMNMVLERTGRRGTGSGLARSFASYGQRVAGPIVGAIAVMSRGRNGGHVGVVSGIAPDGRVIVVSGNHNRRVAEAAYPRSRIYAYVMP